MKMNLLFSVSLMIAASFFIQYYGMSFITVSNVNDITNSLGKFYMSSIMAIMMGLVEVFMHDFTNTNTMIMIHWNYYFVLFLLLSVTYLLYVFQVGISDKEYLKEMIEHHSMALLTSQEIENKTSNYKIKKLAHDIISSQSDQIEYMKKLLKSNY